jgi:hypothetical protein
MQVSGQHDAPTTSTPRKRTLYTLDKRMVVSMPSHNNNDAIQCLGICVGRRGGQWRHSARFLGCGLGAREVEYSDCIYLLRPYLFYFATARTAPHSPQDGRANCRLQETKEDR